MKTKIFLGLMAATVLAFCGTAACTSTGNGHGVKPLETMTELEYSKWKLYIQLGVKIGANRLLVEKVVTADDLGKAADVIDAIRDETLVPGVQSLIMPALQHIGLKNDELQLVLLVAEQELIARGALEWVNPLNNMLELSPRTKEMLGVIASALRSAAVVTADEAAQAKAMNADFSQVR